MEVDNSLISYNSIVGGQEKPHIGIWPMNMDTEQNILMKAQKNEFKTCSIFLW